MEKTISPELLSLFSELVERFADIDGLLDQIPSILKYLGQNLDLLKVSLSIDNEGGPKVFSWNNNKKINQTPPRKLEFQLSKTGINSYIKFEIADNSERYESLLSLIVLMMDAALVSNKTIQAEQSQRQLAESINQISKILTSTLDRDELLSLFLDQLKTLVPYDSANVMLLQNGLLYMHAGRGYEIFSGPVDITQISFVPSETFLMEEVLIGKQPAILEDTKKCPQWIWAPCGEHIRSWMGVPLRVKENVIGLFSIDKSIPNFFTPKHVQLASALAKHAALAVDNALLFAEVQDAHEQLRGLSAKIIEAQEQERQKIAMELHDHTGQALIALRAELRALQFHLPQSSSSAIKQLKYLDQIVLTLSKDITQLAYDLRPPTLTALGLPSALEQYILDFRKRLKICANFSHDLGSFRLPADIELVCYRIVQEALTNLVKHAHASQVEITLNKHKKILHLIVKDNGIGITNSKSQDRRGFGLLGIRERLARINGTLEIKSQPGHGTELIVAIPLNDEVE